MKSFELEDFEYALLMDVLENPEIYNGNRICNDWKFPRYVSEENRKRMVIKQNQYEIKWEYGGDADAYYKNHKYLMNYEVPDYLYERLKNNKE